MRKGDNEKGREEERERMRKGEKKKGREGERERR